MSISTILVPTVGGSCAPILDAIRYHKPDRVYFVCSGDNGHRKGTYTVVDGEGSPCGVAGRADRDPQPNIVTQARLTQDRYRVEVVDDPDDFDGCYRVIDRLLARISAEHPKARILADYTGGTKSLSSALVVAALHRQADLVLIRGKRHDLVRVTDGMTYAHRVSVAAVAADRQFQLTGALESELDYAAAVRTIETITARQALPRGNESVLLDHLQLARAFDAWDMFDHLHAYHLFEALNKPVRRALRAAGFYDALLAVVHSRALVDDAFAAHAADVLKRPIKNAHGYEVVEDLLLNAARRARQGRFDDATARLYRAVELVGQILLRREHGIDTAHVTPEHLPEAIRTEWLDEDAASTQLGLRRAADLLAALDPDGYGPLWRDWQGRVLDALTVRNQSILAHGFRPVSADRFHKVDQSLGGYANALVNKALASRRNPQAPSLALQLPGRLGPFLGVS